MRSYAQIVPTFWTRGSGKKLRGKPYAQVLAMYFMTGPSANMIGLYYVPRLSILNDTGIPESELDGALATVADVGIAFYDDADELVYLPEGAAHQIGETLHPKDKKRSTILASLKVQGTHPFALKWVERYYEPYGLAQDGLRSPSQGPSKPLPSPSEAPPKGPDRIGSVPVPVPVRISDPVGVSPPQPPDQLVADIRHRAQLWQKDPFAASLQYPNPELWAETRELNALVATTFGCEPDLLAASDGHGRIDSRVRVLIDRWADGVPQARMRQAIRGAGSDDLIKGKPQLQSLQTIFKDGNAVDKYCRLAKATSDAGSAGAPPPRRTRKVDPDEEALAEQKRDRLNRVRQEASAEELRTAEDTARTITNLTQGLFDPAAKP